MIYKRVLLLGGSGLLGSHFLNSNSFKNILAPPKKKVNLLNISSISNFLVKNDIKIIINCAAIARMKECELNPQKAIETNVEGSLNLVNAINKSNQKILIVHFSSDSVYGSNNMPFNEKSKLNPYNTYAWTKLSSEYIFRTYPNHIIIRTRFFHEDRLTFKDAATDIMTSAIHVGEIPSLVEKIIKSNFRGIINMGGKVESDFNKFIKFKKNLKKTTFKNIQKNLEYPLSQFGILNSSLLKKITK